jgi:hypothetical protein
MVQETPWFQGSKAKMLTLEDVTERTTPTCQQGNTLHYGKISRT